MSTAPRRVLVVTGTRAEYGLLYWVVKGLHEDPDFELQLIVTGTHLSPEFGMTVTAIEGDGFPIADRIEIILSSDTPIGVSKAMGLALISFSESLARLAPDVVLVLGDRFESFAAAATAMTLGLPIAHCSGGELTEGLIDDAMRHSISKMADLHFPSTDRYRRRVIQLGESPERVFTVGAFGVENIRRLSLLGRGDFENHLGRRLGERNLLVTYHPVTLAPDAALVEFEALLSVLERLSDTLTIFTLPNADAGARAISERLDEFVSGAADAVRFDSMGPQLYLSAISHVDAVIGNSSSGIIEVPSFHKPTLNIGDRQHGREAAASVIHTAGTAPAIEAAIELLYSADFQNQLPSVNNPYDHGNPSAQVLQVLRSVELSDLKRKRFHDLPGVVP